MKWEKESNHQLSILDTTAGHYGRLRVWQSSARYWNSKDKVEFECLDCGTGSEGEWEMQIHNVLIGVGCPACEVLATVVSDFQSLYPQYRLVPPHAQIRPPVSYKHPL